LELDGTVNLGTVLFEEPYNLNPADKIIVWFRPRFDGNDIDTAMYLEVEAVEPVSGYPVTSTLLINNLDGTPVDTFEILNTPTSFTPASGAVVVSYVTFDSWDTGDPEPVGDNLRYTIDGLGLLSPSELFNSSLWYEPLKTWIFSELKPEFNATYTWSLLSQSV